MGVAVLRAGIVLCRLGRLCPSVAAELGAGPICRNLGDLKLAVIVWIGILLAILVEWGAVDNERKPCGVGRGRDIAAGRVGYLSDDAAVSHLMVALADILQPGIGFLEILCLNGNRQRVGGIEGDRLGVERPLGRDRHRILANQFAVHIQGKLVVGPYIGSETRGTEGPFGVDFLSRFRRVGAGGSRVGINRRNAWGGLWVLRRVVAACRDDQRRCASG